MAVNWGAAASSSSSRCIQDVFLSFRGPDTRYKFVGHLKTALHHRGIMAFKDDETLQRGEAISPALLRAIEESEISVVVLSQNYANSGWCLDELVKILECKREWQRIVYPIFYEVNPSDVEHQRGKFGQGFRKLASKNEVDRVEKWRQALQEVANLSGLSYQRPTRRSESKFIEAVVSEIFSNLKHKHTTSQNELVGIESRVEEVTRRLKIGEGEVRVIGILGMGGIGKSTIASIVYNNLSHHFEGSYFIGMEALKELLISNISRENNFRVPNAYSGLTMSVFRHRRILIVIDDVDQSIQIEKLFRMKHYFGHGSRIIITTRDKRVLISSGADDTYQVAELHRSDSIELLISKAFPEGRPTSGFKELIDRTVKYAEGVPLALNCLGSFLKGRSKSQWESALDRLKEWPEERIMEVLRPSYDSLAWTEQQIFLEIACFLNGKKKDFAMRILDSYDLHAEIGIAALLDKSLVKIKSCNELFMHNLIVGLGRGIVHQESEEPGNRSRLWNFKDVMDVLKKNTGTKALKSIVLDAPMKECIVLGERAFMNMTGLRFLNIRDVQLPYGLEFLSNEMRYLKWYEYPLNYLPRSFHPEHLVELCMCGSSLVQLWEGEVLLVNLKIMDLSCSRNLIKTPNFTGIKNLEELLLNGCESLVEVHPSIEDLKKLLVVGFSNCKSLWSSFTSVKFESLEVHNFFGCLRLMSIPEIFGCLPKFWLGDTGIVELPRPIDICGNLQDLSSSCRNLIHPLEYLGNLSSLRELDLSCNGTGELPRSITLLSNLSKLDLENCPNLRSLPEKFGDLSCLRELNLSGTAIGELVDFKVFGSLDTLRLRECNLKNIPTSICSLSLLKNLDLSGNSFENLPKNLIQLPLYSLRLRGCKMLQVLPELRCVIREVDATDCQALRVISNPSTYKHFYGFWFTNCRKLVENLKEKILQSLLEYQFQGKKRCCFQIAFPGGEIPKWFGHKNGEGSSVSFTLSQNSDHCGFLGAIYCAVFYCNTFEEGMDFRVLLNGELVDDMIGGFNPGFLETNSETIWIRYVEFNDQAKPNYGKENEFSVLDWKSTERSPPIKQCGVCLIYSGRKGDVSVHGIQRGVDNAYASGLNNSSRPQNENDDVVLSRPSFHVS